MPFPDSTYEKTWREARASRDFVPGEHSPGPWRADQEKGIVWCNGSNGYLVRDYLCEEPNWNPADLRLIAAAPDLMDVCKWIRNDLLNIPFTNGFWRMDKRDARFIVDSLQYAIDRAEGKHVKD